MMLKGPDPKMLIFHEFFNGYGGVGVENVDFPYVFQMFFGVSESKMLIFHRFFNGFGGVGVENIDFPLVFQWFLEVSVARRVIKLSWNGSAERPRGRIQGSFLPLEEPSSETRFGNMRTMSWVFLFADAFGSGQKSKLPEICQSARTCTKTRNHNATTNTYA